MIDWTKINHFSPSEFPDNPDKNADERVIVALDKYRRRLGNRIFPSTVKGALARLGGSVTSQHYAIGRKSTAVDFFCEGVPISNFALLISMNVFTRIGIYLDTDGPDGLPWVMFHGDLKPHSPGMSTLWVAEKIGKKTHYRYPQRQKEHWKLLSDPRMYFPKEYVVDFR